MACVTVTVATVMFCQPHITSYSVTMKLLQINATLNCRYCGWHGDCDHDGKKSGVAQQ